MPSRQAQIIARTMRRLNMKKLISNNMLNEPKRNFAFEEPGKSFRAKYPIKVYEIDGFKCVYTKSLSDSEPLYHILYFHGGSYTMPAQRAHWHIIDGILSRVNVELTFVNYPLSPEHNCIDTIDMTYKVYKKAAAQNNNLVLMGDSAGGGLALALAQYIARKRKKIRPKKLVLLSPWLDISMDTYASEELKDRDLILDTYTLKVMGQQYAGYVNPHNYLCSPLYGRLKHLGETAIFIGTNDILYAQCQELKGKMEKGGYPLSYYPYEDMHHVWVGYPIPEAREAMDEIAEFLRK